MSNKRFDFSVLPDGFLIDEDWSGAWTPKIKCPRSGRHSRIRPALNYDHFNDGSMVLPDGLVVEFTSRDKEKVKGFTNNNQILTKGAGGLIDIFVMYFYEGSYRFSGGDIIAVRIIGAHPDYAEHANELGIEVVEI